MPSSDPYLRPGLTPPGDVELYESAAEGQGPTTPVAVSATATGVASVSLVVTFGRQFAVTTTGTATTAATHTPGEQPAPPPAPSRGGGAVRPGFVQPRPVPVARHVHVAVRAHCRPTVALVVDHAGRRHQEDELVLAGAI